MKIGARYDDDGACLFRVWAPLAERMTLCLDGAPCREITLERDERGYFSTRVENVRPGSRYRYRIGDGPERPDPASFHQPEGVHKSSAVVDHRRFAWTDSTWRGVPLRETVIYELHVGTFTPRGTFEAVIPRLPELRDIGINTIEIMPVAQFPGERNWGYDGVSPFSVQHSYGGPEGFKKLVDACHRERFAVILDVVYNHLGPEGNYLRDFGPYFTDRYRTPWGEAFNFDGEYSDGVRDYFIENALYWFEYFHVDALRLDAVHGIYDMSADHILRDLARAAGVFSRDCPAGRTYALIAESDLNDPRVVLNCHRGGYGIHAQWCDDFHHVLHALVTGERAGYYLDFGRAAQLPECLNHGFAYHGQYSGHRKRKHGGEACDIPMERFVYFVQNHDQVGNRMLGERLVSLCGADAARLAAACLLFMPGIPLLFMGEEYAESAPFQYFVSHGDPDLVRAVREGRKREFKAFGWENEPPDPQSVETFERSRLDWEKRSRPPHAAMLAFYRACLGLRRRWLDSGGAETEKPSASVLENDRTVIVERRLDNTRLLGLFHFDSHPAKGIRVPIDGAWTKILDGADSRFGGHNSGLPETIDSETALTLSSWQAAWFENKESPS